MKKARRRTIAALFAAGVLSAAAAVPAFAAAPTPNLASADVDGSIQEWTDPTNDFFADMWRAGDKNKQNPVLESKLYMRYDCSNSTVYALVLAESGVSIRANQPADSFIKRVGVQPPVLVDGTSGDDGTPPDFAWVGQQGDTAAGWEASFILPEGPYTLDVHAQVNHDGSQTSALDGREIPLVLDCPAENDLIVSKTANPTFARTFDWNIAKSVDKPTVTTGENTAMFNYTVDVTKGPAADSAFAVDGVITVTNPNYFEVTGVSVTDEIPAVTGETCVVTGGTDATIPAATVEGPDGVATFPYHCDLPSKTDGLNVATVAWGDGSTALGPQSYAFGAPASVTNDTVDVTDAFNGGLPALLAGGDDLNTSAPFTYSRTVNVPASGCVTYPNIATITSPNGLVKNAQRSVEVCRTPTTTQSTPPAPPAPVATVTSTPVVTPVATLRIDKRGPRAATAGQLVTYTIIVKNRGKAAARNVVIADLLPAADLGLSPDEIEALDRISVSF